VAVFHLVDTLQRQVDQVVADLVLVQIQQLLKTVELATLPLYLLHKVTLVVQVKTMDVQAEAVVVLLAVVLVHLLLAVAALVALVLQVQ
jgi:hypothetical protein